MSIKTRLDGRSVDNYGMDIVDTKTGKVIATISAMGRANLTVDTAPECHIVKTNGVVIKRKA